MKTVLKLGKFTSKFISALFLFSFAELWCLSSIVKERAGGLFCLILILQWKILLASVFWPLKIIEFPLGSCNFKIFCTDIFSSLPRCKIFTLINLIF